MFVMLKWISEASVGYSVRTPLVNHYIYAETELVGKNCWLVTICYVSERISKVSDLELNCSRLLWSVIVVRNGFECSCYGIVIEFS